MGVRFVKPARMLFALVLLCTSLFTISADRNTIDTVKPNDILPEVISGSICLNRGEVPEEELHWLYVPVSASELYTEVDYLFLAGQLIQYRVVDASACPGNGLSENGYANACGMAEACDIVLQMQNIYDDEILAAWQSAGVPPIMLKQLIRYESQFWPAQYGLYHYGLGHLTYTGAHTALTWSPILYQATCTAAYGARCEGQLVNDVMIGTLLGMMNASCPACEWKVNIPKAEQSIYYLAHTMLAFCRQTSQTVYNATNRTNPSLVVDYATIWKLTLFNYNVGPNCLYDAVEEADSEIDGRKITWSDVASYVYDDGCQRGIDYVNNITRKFYNFGP